MYSRSTVRWHFWKHKAGESVANKQGERRGSRPFVLLFLAGHMRAEAKGTGHPSAQAHLMSKLLLT